MKLSRTKSYGVLLLCTFTVLGFVSHVTAEEWGIDFWRIGEFEEQIARSENRRFEMEKLDQQITGRTVIRQGIIDNLVADRISLAEAGRGFLALNKTDPAPLNYLRMSFPTLNDNEISVVQVQMQLRYHPRGADCTERVRCEAAGTLMPLLD